MGIVIGYFASTKVFKEGQTLKSQNPDSIFKIYNTIDDLLYAYTLNKQLYIFEVELLSFVDMVEDILYSDEIKILLKNHICDDHISNQIYGDKNKYNYCRLIQDKEELRNNIKDEYINFLYCCYIQDRPELNSKIKSPRYKKLYSQQVKGIDTFPSLKKDFIRPIDMSFVLTNRF